MIKRSTILLFWFFFLFGCASDRNPANRLLIYSPHGKELLTEFEKRFEALNPNVDVQWLDIGSQEIIDRIRSEKANPQADIWWGAPSVIYRQAESEHLLAAYKPSWAGEVSNDARSPDDFWYGTYETPEVIAYNSAAVKSEEAPRDWDDLLEAKWKNKIIVRDPLASGTMRTIFCAMILRFQEESGSPEGGYQWLRRLDANTKDYVANLTLLSQKLARQEGLVTLWNLPDIQLQRTQYQYPLDYVIPESGTPVVTDAIALVAKPAQKGMAIAFYEFVTSKESLVAAAHKFFRIPCRKDIPSAELPEWMNQTRVRAMPVDWDTLEEKSAEWMKYWDENIRNKGAF